MAMDNSTIVKLIKKINFDLVDKFDLTVTKELSFVPVNMQKNMATGEDVFFVAVCKNSDQTKIKNCIAEVINNDVNFIKMSTKDFEILYDTFLNKYSQMHEGVLPAGLRDSNEPDSIEIADDEIALDDDFADISLDEEGSDSSSDLDSNEEQFDDIDDSSSADIVEEDDDFIQEDEDDGIDYGLDGKPKADIKQVKAPETKKLGEILIEEGLLTEEQLEIALVESKSQNIPLGSILVKLGYVTIKDLKEALGAQMGLKYATAEQLKALPTAISILPEDFIKINKVIPLNMTDKTLVIGMVNPNDTKVINEVVYQTGLKPTVMLVTHVEFENFINTYYSADKQETNELLQQINEDDSIGSNGGELWDQVEQEIQDRWNSANKAKEAESASSSDENMSPELTRAPQGALSSQNGINTASASTASPSGSDGASGGFLDKWLSQK